MGCWIHEYGIDNEVGRSQSAEANRNRPRLRECGSSREMMIEINQ
jgi:hypothetical protein